MINYPLSIMYDTCRNFCMRTKSKISSTLQTWLLLVALIPSLAYAQEEAQGTFDEGYAEPISIADDWVPYPYSIQVSSWGGVFLRPIPQIIDPEVLSQANNQYLYILGLQVDASVLHTNQFIWKYFACYPKLGISINVGSVENKGYVFTGRTYVTPRYDYQASWEVTPKLGVGLSYVNIPATNFIEEKDKNEDSVPAASSNNQQLDPYRSGIGLDLLWGIVLNTYFTPHWEINYGLDYTHIVDWKKETDLIGRKGKDLKMVTFSVGAHYTYNPGDIHYRVKDKESTVEVGLLGTGKRTEKKHVGVLDQYYPVVGIYGLWSLPVALGSAITLANEWLLDWAARQDLKNKVKTDYLKISILLGHRFLLGKLTLGQQLGVYIKDNTQVNGINPIEFIYIRLNANCKLMKHFFVGTSLNVRLNHLREQGNQEGRTFEGPNEEFVCVRVGYCF